MESKKLNAHMFLDVLFEHSIKCNRCLMVMKTMLNFPHFRARTSDIYDDLNGKMTHARINKHLDDLVSQGFLIRTGFGTDNIGISYVISYHFFPEVILEIMEHTELNQAIANTEVELLDFYIDAVFGYMEGLKDSYKRAMKATNTYFERMELLKEFFRKV